MLSKLYFIKGEDKRVVMEINAIDNAPFTIESATFELKKNNTVVLSGSCKIKDHQLICQIAPDEIGYYILDVTYQIADETFVKRIEVHVS